MLSTSNYLQLCDKDILKGVDFCDLFLAYVGDYSQVTGIFSPNIQLCDVYR